MLNDTAAEIIGTEPVETAPAADTSTETEQKLATEITQLWAGHNDARSIVKRTQAELRGIRERLAESLFQMHELLARPGRNGGWSAYLASNDIPRTSADRLCLAHARKLNLDENGTSGSVRELSDEEISELAKAVWKKLAKKLGTKTSVYKFLGHLAVESGLNNFRFHRGDQHGLALVDPDAVSTPQVAAPQASATAPTSAA